jgi:hypothetical protein
MMPKNTAPGWHPAHQRGITLTSANREIMNELLHLSA